MPIEKITSAQFRQQLRRGITDRTQTHDVAYGPIRDIVIDPMSSVLERQNDRIRAVSLLVSLQNSDEFTDDDLDALVFNEGLTRITGAQATATLVFSTTALPTIDLIVPRGFPVATTPDAATGESSTFVTTETVTLPAAQASSYRNFEVTPAQYELEVPAVAVTPGTAGNVGATRIRRPLRPLVGFDSVTNPEAASGGRARETNAELIERYLLAIQGRDLATPLGIERYTKDNFATVTDVKTIHGNNPLLTRNAGQPGTVDAYVVGEELVTRSDSLPFVGANQLIAVDASPVRDIVSVENIDTSTTYTEGTHYEATLSSSDLQGSTRASEGVTFLASAPVLPNPGEVIRITYTSNNLIRRLQSTFEQDDTLVFGRDLLFKEGVRVDLILEAQLKVAAGFSTVTVPSVVETTIVNYINGLSLGEVVERSDIQAAVRQITGVDNFVFTRLVRDATVTGATDIAIADNEYARITAGPDLAITLI